MLLCVTICSKTEPVMHKHPSPKSAIMKKKESKPDRKKTHEEIRQDIGQRIKSMRRRSRGALSARAVAEKLGISRVTLTQIENGKRNINAVLLWEVACRLGCNIQELFPSTPAGFQITERDVEEVKKVDKKAVKWLGDLFGKPTNGTKV